MIFTIFKPFSNSYPKDDAGKNNAYEKEECMLRIMLYKTF